MKIKDKINLDIEGLKEHGAINIVIFGDSVSHGALKGSINYETVYWNLLRQKMNALRDYMPVNMINSSIGGLTASDSLPRIERDILSHNPDLVIVCFGLNDVNLPVEEYLESLSKIFGDCQNAGLDIIFMTPNMLNTYVDEENVEPQYYNVSIKTARFQNEGVMDNHIYSAIKLAKDMGVTVCDCYSEWKKLYDSGVDTTKLLINRINHPTQEMHKLFADMLFDIIFGTEEFKANEFSDTMYRE